MNELKKQLRKTNKLTTEGGESMNAKAVVELLKKYDRMPENPDFPSEDWVARSLERSGKLSLFVFVCPAVNGSALKTENKEDYLPKVEPSNGLVWPRIPKLIEVTQALLDMQIPIEIIFAIADNSYQLYKQEIIGITIPEDKLKERRQIYMANLRGALQKKFGNLSSYIDMWSMGILGIGEPSENEEITVPEELIKREMSFQKEIARRFYKEDPSDDILRQMATLKMYSYARQGKFVQDMGALLISTEGSDSLASWQIRTSMLQLCGRLG